MADTIPKDVVDDILAKPGSRRTTQAERRAASGDKPPGIPKVTPRSNSLEARLAQTLAGMSMIPSMAGDQYSAMIIATRSGAMAHGWSELAKENAHVRRILEGLLEGGAWAGVVVPTAAVVIPILGHYGIIPTPDPFAAFYPPLPEGVQQNPPRVKGSPKTRADRGRVERPQSAADNAASSRTPAGAPPAPPGVVTAPPPPPMHPGALA